MKAIGSQTARPKVLLVDDEPKICAALAGALISEGFDVLYEESGDEALAAACHGNFDLVLLDLRMPGQSGWETLAQLRKERPLLPVIIITALPGQQAAAKEAGVDALMEKPLEIPLLLETMRALVAESFDARRAGIAAAAAETQQTKPTSAPATRRAKRLKREERTP